MRSHTMHLARRLAHPQGLRPPSHRSTAAAATAKLPVTTTPQRLVAAHASAAPAAASASPGVQQAAPPTWDIRMLYDGECPLCMKEVNFLKGRDAGKGRVDFVDVAASSYDPAANAGITFDQAMERIHAILPDGRVVTDVEVFRRLYEAVGLGWVYAVTRWEPVGKLADAAYAVWARYRMQLTGREALEVILERRRLDQASNGAVGASCRAEGASCEVPSDR